MLFLFKILLTLTKIALIVGPVGLLSRTGGKKDCTFHVIVEQEPTCELSVFSGSLIHLIASYFIYDIAYPKYLKATLIQHHVMGLSDKQSDLVSVVELVTSLRRMDSTFN